MEARGHALRRSHGDTRHLSERNAGLRKMRPTFKWLFHWKAPRMPRSAMSPSRSNINISGGKNPSRRRLTPASFTAESTSLVLPSKSRPLCINFANFQLGNVLDVEYPLDYVDYVLGALNKIINRVVFCGSG